MNSDKQSRDHADDGSAAVETGMTISLLLLLILGSVEFGRAFWTYNTMGLAVEEAGRYAMVYNQGPGETCSPQSQASQCPIFSDTPLANCSAERVHQVLSTYQAPSIAVSVNEDTNTYPPTMTICASYFFDFLPLQSLPYGPLSLTRQITVPLL